MNKIFLIGLTVFIIGLVLATISYLSLPTSSTGAFTNLP